MFDFLSKKDRTPPALPEGTERRRYTITGQVQGVGFRYRARYAAQTLDLTGWVQNEDDGSVTLEVQGDPENLTESDFYALDPARVTANGRLAVTRLLDHTLWVENSPLKVLG